MSGRTGYTAPTNDSAFAPPADMTVVYEHFDPLTGETVATAFDLPAASNWVGRTIFVADTKTLYVWDGTEWDSINADTGWIDATSLLTASWASYQPTTWGKISYRKSGVWVELSGNAQFTAGANSTIFTLPVGFRPSFLKGFVTDRGGTHATVNVGPDGVVASPSITAVGQTLMLSGVHFMIG